MLATLKEKKGGRDGMDCLEFKNAVFNHGVNVTVRRGDKWADLRPGSIVELRAVQGTSQTRLWNVEILRVVIVRFADLQAQDIEHEHDPQCRTLNGLYEELTRIYPGFKRRDVVTVLTFCAV